MDDVSIMYDEMEDTRTRYIGYLGNHSRYDVAITNTGHFYGKSLVTVIQTGRTAIMSVEEAESPEYLMAAFSLQSEAEADEFSIFLSTHF